MNRIRHGRGPCAVVALTVVTVAAAVAQSPTLNLHMLSSAGGASQGGGISLFVVGGTSFDLARATSTPYSILPGLLVGFDLLGPQVAVSSTGPASEGSPFTVQASVSDPSGVQGATLYCRRGGESAFTAVQMTASGGGQYTADIPASASTSRGIEYYILATDVAGNQSYYPSTGVQPLRVAVGGDGVVASSPQPGGDQQTAYRLVSIPLDATSKSPDAVLLDDVGSADKTQWRLFEWTPGQSLAEYPYTSSFAPGKALWLIVRSSRTIDTGPGLSVLTGSEYPIQLNGGWTLIGNPFNFTIPVTNLRIGSSLSPVVLRAYGGSWNDPAGSPVTELRPFEGYAVSATSATTLYVDPTARPALGREKPSAGTVAWAISVKAQCAEARDIDNIALASAEASEQLDDMDLAEPPVIGEYVSLSFPHPEWESVLKRYCVDARPVPSSGEVWDMDVKSNMHDVVRLEFSNLETVPSGLDVRLVDASTAAAQDLRETSSYRFVSGGEHLSRQLKLLVGTPEYMAEALKGLHTVPVVYELSQNFPNPFNPMTTIRFGVPADSRVKVEVYDLLGRQVEVLLDDVRPAGYHSVIWDARNSASGMYVYTLRATSVDGSGRSSTLAKKLVVVK